MKLEAGLSAAREQQGGPAVDAEDGVHGRPMQVRQSKYLCLYKGKDGGGYPGI